MFRSSAPFSFNGQRQVTRREDAQLPVREADTTQSVKTEYSKKATFTCFSFILNEKSLNLFFKRFLQCRAGQVGFTYLNLLTTGDTFSLQLKQSVD